MRGLFLVATYNSLTAMAWTVSHPHLLLEWSPKNTVKAADARKAHKYIWDCQIKTTCGCTHEWKSTLQDRLKGCGCPFCCIPAQRVCIHNSLAVKFPEVAAQWHMNGGDLTPQTVGPNSSKQVPWLCPKTNCEAKCQHVWTARIGHRTGEAHSGCPFCSGRQCCPHNSLAAKSQAIAAMWHPTKNGTLLPTEVTPRSHKPATWLCPETNCEAKCEHVWTTTPHARARHGCPFCSGLKYCSHNSLAAKSPAIAATWHLTLNGQLTPTDVSLGSSKPAVWLCPETNCEAKCAHVWTTSIANRNKSGCTFCCNPPQSFCAHNSFGAKFPAIASEWHKTKNGTLTALTVAVHSNMRVWWTCQTCKHDWRTSVCNRTKESGTNCPHCCVNKGERYLREELAKIAGVTVNEQATFDDLMDQKQLRYDTTMKHPGLQRLVIIEADGVLHFPHLLYGESEQLPQDTIDGVRRDLIKNKHCKKHGFHMLRIGMYHLNAKDMATIIPKFLSDCAAYEQKYGTDAPEGLYRISDKELYMAMREFIKHILHTKNKTTSATTRHPWRKRKRKQVPSADDPDPF